MTLALADVRDLDCVLAWAPLQLGLSAREVSGAPAVLRRVLYRWCTTRGLLPWDVSVGLGTALQDMPGVVLSPADLLGLRQALRREAMQEDFVYDAQVTVTLDVAGALRIRAAITLVDGKTYPLEVSVSEAGAALVALGGA